MKQAFLLFAAFIFTATALRLANVKANDLAKAKPGTVFRDCADCPEMVVIPAGSRRSTVLRLNQFPMKRPNIALSCDPSRWANTMLRGPNTPFLSEKRAIHPATDAAKTVSSGISSRI